jgi:hypothetical protein
MRCSDKLKAALAFVQEQKRHGIELMVLDGLPTLNADPGITPEDKERWQAMAAAVDSILACRTELCYLVKRGWLKLQKHEGYGT